MVKESFLAQFYGKSQNYTDIPNKWYKEYNVKKGLNRAFFVQKILLVQLRR